MTAAQAGSLFRNTSFLRYWGASTVSILGSQLSVIAFPLLALSLTHSVTAAGLLATCSLITRMVVRMPAGLLADRMDRRWMMLGADLVRLVALGSIPLAAGLASLTFEQLLVVAVVEGTATAFFSPASDVAMRDVVSKEHRTEALSRYETTASSAMLVGPAVGGWLYSVDRILPFTVDALSYLVSAVLLIGMSVGPIAHDPDPDADRRMTAGVHWLRRQPKLLWVLLFVASLNLAGTAAEIGVVLSLRTEGASGSAIGLVMAGAGVGAVLGSVFAARIIKVLRTGLLFLTIGLIWGGGFAVYALKPPVAVVGVILVLLLVVIPPAGIVIGGAILDAPRDLVGRVGTAVNTGTMALSSVGPLLVGVAIEGLGITGTWIVLAVLVVLVAVATARPLWRVDSLVDPAGSDEPDATELFGDELFDADADSAFSINEFEIEAYEIEASEKEVVAHSAEAPTPDDL